MVRPQPLLPLPPRVPRRGERWELVFDLTALLLGLAGFVSAAHVGLLAFGETFHLLGESSTPAEQVEASRLWRIAVTIGSGVPLVGLLLSLWVRRRAAVVSFVVLLALSLVPTGLVAVDEIRRWEPAPAEPRPVGCQEHSGGDNRCPGG